MARLEWQIPIRTVSELNCTEHWTKKHKRHKTQKRIIQLCLKKDIKGASLPCEVTITRISPRLLDFDNLVASQKWVVDSICDLLLPGLAAGRADGDDRIKVQYAQEKGDRIGLKIAIVST